MHFSLSILLLGIILVGCSQVQHPLLPTDLQSISEVVSTKACSSAPMILLILTLGQCRLLVERLPDLVTFPIDHKYKVQESLYWSLDQAQQRPACRIAPETVDDVASVVDVLRNTESSFAIKSGGHSSVVNASNVDGGVTIDLSKLSSIAIASDRRSVLIGSGVRWRDVYHQLEAPNLSISGARAGSVGVGGYLLGGRALRCALNVRLSFC